jgi:formate-dependent nitrite reductase membrane component NrfD
MSGPLAAVYQVGSIGMGTVAPLVLHQQRRRARRAGKRGMWLGLVSSALVLAGGLITRFAITEAGKRSADDPQAYFGATRPADETED